MRAGRYSVQVTYELVDISEYEIGFIEKSLKEYLENHEDSLCPSAKSLIKDMLNDLLQKDYD